MDLPNRSCQAATWQQQVAGLRMGRKRKAARRSGRLLKSLLNHDGASRARTGDLLGAITPHTGWLVLVRLAPARRALSVRRASLSSVARLVARNYRLSDARRESDNDSTSGRAAARTRRRHRRCAFDAVGQALGARSCSSWRSSIRRILPVSVFGRSLTNSISRG